MSDYTIRATPEVLVSASADILKKAEIVEDVFSVMQAKVQQTSSFWTGDAAELHRALFDEHIPAMESIVLRFKAHADKLKQIAGNYANAKATVMTVVEELPNDVIV